MQINLEIDETKLLIAGENEIRISFVGAKKTDTPPQVESSSESIIAEPEQENKPVTNPTALINEKRTRIRLYLLDFLRRNPDPSIAPRFPTRRYLARMVNDNARVIFNSSSEGMSLDAFYKNCLSTYCTDYRIRGQTYETAQRY